MKDNNISVSSCPNCENHIPDGFKHIKRLKLISNGSWVWFGECLQIKQERSNSI